MIEYCSSSLLLGRLKQMNANCCHCKLFFRDQSIINEAQKRSHGKMFSRLAEGLSRASVCLSVVSAWDRLPAGATPCQPAALSGSARSSSSATSLWHPSPSWSTILKKNEFLFVFQANTHVTYLLLLYLKTSSNVNSGHNSWLSNFGRCFYKTIIM